MLQVLLQMFNIFFTGKTDIRVNFIVFSNDRLFGAGPLTNLSMERPFNTSRVTSLDVTVGGQRVTSLSNVVSLAFQVPKVNYRLVKDVLLYSLGRYTVNVIMSLQACTHSVTSRQDTNLHDTWRHNTIHHTLYDRERHHHVTSVNVLKISLYELIQQNKTKTTNRHIVTEHNGTVSHNISLKHINPSEFTVRMT